MNTKEILQRIREKRIDAEFTNRLLVDLEADIGKCEKQIELMEDAVMIYHMQRAPTRRIWYVNVGRSRGDRAKWILKDFRDEYVRKVDQEIQEGNEGASYSAQTMIEDVYLPRWNGDDENNSAVEHSDIQTTWDGGALLETLYAKRDRLLTQYSRLFVAVEKNEVMDILKVICETPSWRMR